MALNRMVLILLLGALAGSANAQGVPTVPTEVSGVLAGGYWTSGAQEGSYRIIIVSGGFEHIVSQVFLQWLSQPTSPNDSVVVLSTVELEAISAGGWQATNPQFELKNKKWEATIASSNSHTDPISSTRWRLTLGPPGSYSIATEAFKP